MNPSDPPQTSDPGKVRHGTEVTGSQSGHTAVESGCPIHHHHETGTSGRGWRKDRWPLAFGTTYKAV